MNIDWTLYLVADCESCGAGNVLDVVSQAVAGGVSIVQLRDKESSDQLVAELARELLALLKPFSLPLIINDRVELAHVVGATGVHLGAEDCHVLDARAMLGGEAIIGLSVDSEMEVMAVDMAKLPVDYMAIGPVFETNSKIDLPEPLGIKRVKAVRAVCSLPLIGIGGIDPTNAKGVFEAGVDGVAVISAICNSKDPRVAAKLLRACKTC